MSQPPLERSYSTAGIVALIVIGLLLLIPSGLCSAILVGGTVIAMFSDPRNFGGASGVFPTVLVVAGPFVAGGGAMLITGIRRARANARNREHQP